MARPTKWRRVEQLPRFNKFVPTNIPEDHYEENILKVEEIEAVRLKDIEGFEQEECAKKMNVSRQTFQRILGDSRKKIADSIINGKAIKIEGGNFTFNICNVECLKCGKEWNESFENFQKIKENAFECPECNSQQIACINRGCKKFCKKNCKRNNAIHQQAEK